MILELSIKTAAIIQITFKRTHPPTPFSWEEKGESPSLCKRGI